MKLRRAKCQKLESQVQHLLSPREQRQPASLSLKDTCPPAQLGPGEVLRFTDLPAEGRATGPRSPPGSQAR